MGGKSSPPPPDYGPIAKASREAAEIMAGLGREQLAFARQQYGEMMPLARQVADQQMATQRELMDMGRADRQYQIETFRPVERGLVADAERFSTEGFREQQAREAAAAAGRAFGITQDATARAAASRGISLGSGAGMAMSQQANLGLAAQRANAMTGARTQAEQLGFARRMDVTGLGRGLGGAALGAYGAATGAGSAGMQTSMAPGGQYMQGMAQGASTIGSGQSMQLGGLGNILNSQTSTYNAAMNQSDPIMGLIGTGIGAYGALSGSDRRLKQDIELVGRDERTGLPLYEFAYKADPSRRFIGVMADEVEAYMPEAVGESEDGYKFVNYGMLGIEMVEV
jgi:hypothetical protein